MSQVTFSGFRSIVAHPDFCDGQPRIDGTRITVKAILTYIAGGMSVEQIASAYANKISTENIYEALAFASA
jgi:uncharacterized protein (DUF433 family)